MRCDFLLVPFAFLLAPPSPRDQRQDEVRRVAAVVKDGLPGRAQLRVHAEVMARVGIAIVAWEVARR